MDWKEEAKRLIVETGLYMDFSLPNGRMCWFILLGGTLENILEGHFIFTEGQEVVLSYHSSYASLA